MRIGVVVGLLCACSAIADAQPQPSPELAQRVDAIVKRELARPLAGVSVAGKL
jgi:hypothetical protein